MTDDETRDNSPPGRRRNEDVKSTLQIPEFSPPIRSDDETSLSSLSDLYEFGGEEGLYLTRWRRLERRGGGKDVEGESQFRRRKEARAEVLDFRCQHPVIGVIDWRT